MTFAKLFLFLSALLIGCSTTVPPKTTITEKQIISQIQDSTVIILAKNENMPIIMQAACTGVWVSKDVFVTARHCVGEVGMVVYYKSWSDVSSSDTFNETYIGGARTGIVKALNPKDDLALVISVEDPPKHSIAFTSKEEVEQGDRLHIIGHGGRLTYTYMSGWVSTVRTMDTPNEFTTKVIQVSFPIWYGDSGCGAFNQRGELIGICSFLTRRAPNAGFFSDTEAVRKFVTEELKEMEWGY